MNPRVILISLILCPVFGLAQVGVGTTTTDASARFQIDASSGTNDNPKGFLPPRVALAATNSIAPFSTITPATGLLVYNTAAAGSGSSAVTPGFYYYDGAKWQRVINQQPDATVTFNADNPNTTSPAPTFDPPGDAAKTDFIYVSTTNNSQWTWNGSAYVTYNPPASTAWYSSGGTTDAGSNKTGTVYRTGSVGIGSTTTPDASAQLDVNSSSKGFLPPRVALTATNAAGPITSPATGLLVYNTATAGTSPNNVTPGYYFNSGTAAAPTWSAVQVVTATTGVETRKVIYDKANSSSGDVAQPMTLGQLIFTFDVSVSKFKLSSNPGQDVIVYFNIVENFNGGGYASTTDNRTFTSSNWNTYQTLGAHLGAGEVNTSYITCSNENKAYRITKWIQGSGSRYNYVLLGEGF
jgi:hypothetical protein